MFTTMCMDALDCLGDMGGTESATRETRALDLEGNS